MYDLDGIAFVIFAIAAGISCSIISIGLLIMCLAVGGII